MFNLELAYGACRRASELVAPNSLRPAFVLAVGAVCCAFRSPAPAPDALDHAREAVSVRQRLAAIATPPVCVTGGTRPRPQSKAAARMTMPVIVVQPAVMTTAPIVVTAKRSTAPRDQTTLRLNDSDVQRYLPTTVTDALVGLPGVQLAKTGPWAATPVLRGLAGNRVQVQVDGVSLNLARGHGAQPSLVSAGDVEAVELTMGATSARNGSGGMGGTV